MFNKVYSIQGEPQKGRRGHGQKQNSLRDGEQVCQRDPTCAQTPAGLQEALQQGGAGDLGAALQRQAQRVRGRGRGFIPTGECLDGHPLSEN